MYIRLLFLVFLTSAPLFAGLNLDSILVTIQSDSTESQIQVLNDICWKNRSNNTLLAIQAGEASLLLTRKIKNTALEARTLNLLGVVNRSYGNINKSLSYLNEALRVATESNNLTEIAYSENNIGGSYRMKAYFTLAFQHVSKALRIFEALKDSSGMSYALINVGFIYQGQKNHQKALEYFQKTYDLRKRTNDSLGILIALGEIARTQMEQGDFQSAIKNFLYIEKQSALFGDESGLVRAHFGLGEIYIKMKKFETALEYEMKAYTGSVNAKNAFNTIRTAENLCIILSHQRRFSEAKSYAKKALEMALPLNDYSLIATCYSAYAKFYELSGNYQKALMFSNLYADMRDSITSIDNISSVSEMEALYQNEKVKRDNAVLQKNFEIAETRSLYSLIIALLFVAISAALLWRYRTHKRAFLAEEQRRRSEEKYLRIFQNAYMGIFHVTTDSRFITVNPAMAQLFGYITPDDFLSKYRVFSDLPAHTTNPPFPVLWSNSQTKEWNSQEFVFILPGGQEIITLINIRKEMIDADTIAYIEGFVENITERKLAEEEKEKYSADLINLNAAKDKLFSIISHDLRGPYQGFLGMIGLLAEKPEDFPTDKLKYIATTLYSAAENQYQLLNDLLNWSRLQTGDFTMELEPLSVRTEINSIMNNFLLSAKRKSITIENRAPENIVLTADRSMLHMLMRNLVSNSIKFTKPGGFVLIDANSKASGTEITVTDNGVGIAEENTAKLFQIGTKYSTEGTDNEQGSGLGLTLCAEIVQKHKGTITVQSKINSGTKITVFLPDNLIN